MGGSAVCSSQLPLSEEGEEQKRVLPRLKFNTEKVSFVVISIESTHSVVNPFSSPSHPPFRDSLGRTLLSGYRIRREMTDDAGASPPSVLCVYVCVGRVAVNSRNDVLLFVHTLKFVITPPHKNATILSASCI